MALKTWDTIFQFVVHLLMILFVFGVLGTLMIKTLPTDQEHATFFLTNTFLSVFETSTPYTTYTPVSDPYVANEMTDTFYSCAMEAEVAMNAPYNCPGSDTSAYITCLNSFVGTAFKIDRIITSVKSILGLYPANSTEIVQMGSPFTDQNFEASLRAILADNLKRTTLKMSLSMLSTPVSIELMNAIKTGESTKGIDTCVTEVQSSVMMSTLPHYDIGPLFDTLWKCASNVIVVEKVQKRVYDKCIPLTKWPALDVMQGVYTSLPLGSYNKFFFCFIALWFLCSFMVYTFPGVDSAPTPSGKPAEPLATAGKVMVTFGFVWNLISFILVFLYSFTSGDKLSGFTMSVQTVLVSMFFTFTVCFYFGSEVYELFFNDTQRSSKPVSQKSNFSYSTRNTGAGRYQNLSAFIQVPSATTKFLHYSQYIPLVSPVWTDAWFFVDPLLFLCVIGVSADVVTADLVVCVIFVVASSMVNSSLIRLLYEGYINDAPSEGVYETIFNSKQQKKIPRSDVKQEDRALFSVRVMAMIASITSLLFSIIVFMLLYWRYAFVGYPTLYFMFTSLIPQIVFLIYTLVLEYDIPARTGILFYNCTAYFFYIHIFMRMIVFSIIADGVNKNYDLTYGSETGLNVLMRYINTNSV